MTTGKQTEDQTSSIAGKSGGTTKKTGNISGQDEVLIRLLRRLIGIAVRILAVIMVAVIFWGVADVGYVLYQRLLNPPVGFLQISDILATFGAFMAVLIAIEIFHNIVLYLRSDAIHIKVVLATALMAIARKVIVLDFNETSPMYVFGIAAVVLALGIVYWMVVVWSGEPQTWEHHIE